MRAVPSHIGHSLTLPSFPPAVYTILETLPLYSGLDTPGLLNSTLYDTIQTVPGAEGNVAVNATQFVVDCGTLSNVTISNFTLFSEEMYVFNVDVGMSQVRPNPLPAGEFP